MELTEKDVQKLAELARIELTPAERRTFGAQLSSILDYVKQVQEVDTSQVGDVHHLPVRLPVFRSDDVQPPTGTEQLLSQFPERAGNLNKVKAVLE